MKIKLNFLKILPLVIIVCVLALIKNNLGKFLTRKIRRDQNEYK